MIYSLTGTLVHTEPGAAVVDVGGVAFRCMTSMNTLRGLPRLSEKVTLYTYLNVREDALDLFGFATKGELSCFRLLTSISGVGPKVGLAILSQLSPEDVALAAAAGDAKRFTKASGVGQKLAQRIVLELKDKVRDLSGGMGMEAQPRGMENVPTRRLRAMLEGIGEAIPGFDLRRDAVSDCFGDLGEFQRLFLSGNCDGWITFDAGRMTDFARLAVSYPQKLVPAVALLEGCSVPVPPFFSRFFCEDPYAKMRKLVTLYQQKAPSGEYPVSYKNISGKGEQR